MKRILKAVKTGLVKFWKDEKGEGGPIKEILWGAILILAIIGLKAGIDAAFNAFGNSFSTWLASKSTDVFR